MFGWYTQDYSIDRIGYSLFLRPFFRFPLGLSQDKPQESLHEIAQRLSGHRESHLAQRSLVHEAICTQVGIPQDLIVGCVL